MVLSTFGVLLSARRSAHTYGCIDKEKADYRISHLLRYIKELEAKALGDAHEKEISKLNYRIAHLLKYIEELEDKKSAEK